MFKISVFKISIIAVVIVIGAILIIAATRPATFRVERSTRISAPPERIFHYVNDFHQWGVWSPYEKLDPSMKRTYGGAGAGKGAVYEWDGNSKAGQGRMEIIESAQPANIVIKLDFIKPFEAHNKVVFTLTPKGDATEVNWAMQGPVPYMAKIVHVFMDMDGMVGKDFEAGLANLKAVTEK